MEAIHMMKGNDIEGVSKTLVLVLIIKIKE